jgi:hypothetical protein
MGKVSRLIGFALLLVSLFALKTTVSAHDEKLPQYPPQRTTPVNTNFSAQLTSVTPAPPACVYRNGTPAQRLLTINGQNLDAPNYSLEFQDSESGASTIFIRGEATWTANQVTLDIDRVRGLIFPNQPKVSLQVRLRAYESGNYNVASDWSPLFLLATDEPACSYVAPPPRLIEPPLTRTIDVYVMNFDPFINGLPVHQYYGWNDPNILQQSYLSDVREVSGGVINYRIVKQSDIRTYPFKSGGFVFTNEQYQACVNNGSSGYRCQELIDYAAVLQFNYDTAYGSACNAIINKDIDEIWLWGGAWFGYFEFNNLSLESMCGTSGRYKEFSVMGFNYERGVAEMLHDLGHRSETALISAFGLNFWNTFDGQWGRGTPDIDPTKVQHCGNVHYPPNARIDYDYARDLPVQSDCADWKNYPNRTGITETVNYTTWCLSGDCQRGYLKWWFDHFPRRAGFHNNKLLNWWQYLYPHPRPLLNQPALSVSLNAASGNIPVTLNGLDFKPGAIVYAGDLVLPTTFVSSTRLIAVITKTAVPQADISWTLQVYSPLPGGGGSITTTVNFTCSPLSVTLTDDDSTCGTFRHALAVADSGANKTITLNLAPGAVISSVVGFTLVQNVQINGSCDAPVVLQGGNSENAVGLTLLGKNTVKGVTVRGWRGGQIRAAGLGNTLDCVRAGG